MLRGFITFEKRPAFIAHRRPGNMIENKQQNMCHSAQGGKSPAV
jgi:hypothetical protein